MVCVLFSFFHQNGFIFRTWVVGETTFNTAWAAWAAAVLAAGEPRPGSSGCGPRGGGGGAVVSAFLSGVPAAGIVLVEPVQFK
jgi:hypothetical protein